MSIWDIDKLQLFIMFVIPGFISIKTYELLYPSQLRDSSKQIVDAITYSCINYAILYWFIDAIESQTGEGSFKAVHPNLYLLFYVFVLLVFPVILAFLWKALRESETFKANLHHPTQKPWDYFFSQGKCFWVKVTLKDGSVIGGYYGENSFASSAPAEEQLYLEQTWKLNENGGFERKVNATAGVIILTSEISHIEFRDV
ncbi:hypothetical protein HYO55_15030 [Vibrio parahaemolyticus]|uniref:DUF6338 family protein n=1 Tax=Vibrio harveyi TaxID=669 RepID=UPI0005395738|nr:DUF6338 family protein [Vibrio harveyi]AIV05950.1 hypothetical protein LA59_10900 [Vibrio harveyi]EIA3186911.1 hypothetical protein [Vibrio parahaemolyticus]MBM4840420.1 hypothetical protein [Vibrio parahaemolyticus]